MPAAPRVPKAKSMRKRMASKKKSKASRNEDTFFLKANLQGTLNPVQGIKVSNYISWFPQLLNAESTYNVAQSAEFAFWSKLYDQVRVNSMTIRVTPKANVLDQTNAQDDEKFTIQGDGLVHHVIDRDSLPPQNISALQRYSSYRKTSVLKPFTRTYSVKWPVGVWLDTANIFEDDTLLKRLGCNGGIYVYAENVLEDLGELFNEPFATVSITYNCVFRGKVMGALSFNDTDGSVTLTPFDKLPRSADTEPTILTGAINSTRLDASGNIVAMADTDLP